MSECKKENITIKTFKTIGHAIPKNKWFTIGEVFNRTEKKVNRLRIRQAIDLMISWSWVCKSDEAGKHFRWVEQIDEMEDYTNQIKQSFDDGEEKMMMKKNRDLEESERMGILHRRKQEEQARNMKSDNILHAPSILRGELVGSTGKHPYASPDDTLKPIVNSKGDHFTDVCLMSGKPILRKRIGERFLTNRSRHDRDKSTPREREPQQQRGDRY